MKHPETLRIKTISGSWCDKDIVMLHACFQLLMNCVEKENLLQEKQRSDDDESRKNIVSEIEALYDWWKKRRKAARKGLNELDPAQYAEDTAMLIRLISIRQHLWT